MKTFLQTVDAALREARMEVKASSEDGHYCDMHLLHAHLESVAKLAGKEWWLALESSAYTGGDVPLSVWRSAIREHAPSGYGLLSRWIRARPARCPDALKAAAMAQELKNEAN